MRKDIMNWGREFEALGQSEPISPTPDTPRSPEEVTIDVLFEEYEGMHENLLQRLWRDDIIGVDAQRGAMNDKKAEINAATGYRVNEKSDDGAVRPRVGDVPGKSVEACQLSATPASEPLPELDWGSLDLIRDACHNAFRGSIHEHVTLVGRDLWAIQNAIDALRMLSAPTLPAPTEQCPECLQREIDKYEREMAAFESLSEQIDRCKPIPPYQNHQRSRRHEHDDGRRSSATCCAETTDSGI